MSSETSTKRLSQVNPFRAFTSENVEWTSFTGYKLAAINESARLLREDGQLTIETGSGVRPHLDAIKQRMRETGFHFIRVTVLRSGKIRISARRRTS